jgi:hypothetical protein
VTEKEQIEQLFEIGIRGMYFRRDGTPYRTASEWAEDFSKGIDRRVDETLLWWGGRVSTVWLGLNHNYIGGPPLIFETMLFGPKSLDTLDMDRYATEAQAIAGHKQMVKRWKFAFGKIIWACIWVVLNYLCEFWVKDQHGHGWEGVKSCDQLERNIESLLSAALAEARAEAFEDAACGLSIAREFRRRAGEGK